MLDITGEDVAAFSDELLLHAKTYTVGRREALNRDIIKKVGKRKKSEQVKLAPTCLIGTKKMDWYFG